MRARSFPTLFLGLALAGPASAQFMNPSIEIAPNPVPPGAQITITVTAPQGTAIEYYPGAGSFATWPAMCLVYDSLNSPNPFIGFCNSIPGVSFRKYALAAQQTVSQTFNFCAPPGDYAVQLPYFMPGSTQQLLEWACFRVQGSGPEATLAASTVARVGQALSMSIAAPGSPVSAYVLAPAFTSNLGITLPNLSTLCIDPDALFQLFVSGAGTPLFFNFVGTLDGLGNSQPINMIIPQIPQLAFLPLKMQALVGDLYGSMELTNQLNFCIQP